MSLEQKGPARTQALPERGLDMARIILCEDDEAIRAFVTRALEMDGHEIIAAVDGEDGFDRLQDYEGAVDLLLTDIKMPFMDGIELAHSASALWPDLRILMMTGFADQRERTETLNALIVDVVSKPFTLAQIRSEVAKALRYRIEPMRRTG